MCRLAICGQRSRARARSRCSREALAESGYRATAVSFSWRLVPSRLPGARELARGRHKDQRLRRIERMPMPSPCQIALSGDEQAVLRTRARSVRGSYRDRLRAAIVLAAAAGLD